MNAAMVEESMFLLRVLETLLTEEREALARGELARAAEATRKKEKVIARLRELDLKGLGEEARKAASAMEALSAGQEKNISILKDMVSGIEKELSGLRARRKSLRAYVERPLDDGAAYLNSRT